ncbi:peptidase family M1 [Dictyocaulus viviparus]|uniref:Peptidase family M1 n=1 Tax=Dictyocaulus viviparus TaxID=29172 RepID=A0A0D8XN12_DICVI|nr:peptidase family M1 [Dictyocaulus viviparus]
MLNKRNPLTAMSFSVSFRVMTIFMAMAITSVFVSAVSDAQGPSAFISFRERDIEYIKDTKVSNEFRLPTDLVPLEYNLSIKTYLPFYVPIPYDRNLTFDGNVVITIKVMKPTHEIVLNMVNITLKSLECKMISATEIRAVEIKKVIEYPNLKKISVVLSETLNENDVVTFKMEYTGLISRSLDGLYQTSYTGKDGRPKIAAVTQFQPAYAARLMVSCFDEPLFKANWTVTVIHPNGTSALSNGIEICEDRVVTKFATTPAMSSYLLAVFVSEYNYTEGKTKSGVRYRVWSSPHLVNTTQYALQAGIVAHEFFEEYFGVGFSLKKQGGVAGDAKYIANNKKNLSKNHLIAISSETISNKPLAFDMVAIPQINSRGMENWGLITFKETVLLYDEKFVTPSSKQQTAILVAHQLAHQWFGNLVTMKWWNDFWLNEGFATMLSYIGANPINEMKLRMEDYFLVDSFEQGLHADSFTTTHPLSLKVDDILDVKPTLDKISYHKGASVLFMIYYLIGEDDFLKGVKHHLEKYSYSNIQTSDLWSSFDEVVGNIKGPYGRMINMTYFGDQWSFQLCDFIGRFDTIGHRRSFSFFLYHHRF